MFILFFYRLPLKLDIAKTQLKKNQFSINP